MSDESQDKQHLPTGKRLFDMRRQGNVLRSRDLSGGLIFLVSVGLLIYLSTDLKVRMQENFIFSFSNIKNVMEDPTCIGTVVNKLLLNNIKGILPIFIISFFTAFLSPFLFGGWNFTLEALQFKLTKLNPAQNIKRIFSFNTTLLEVLRAMIKVIVFFGALIAFIISNKNTIMLLAAEAPLAAIPAGFFIIKNFIVFICVALVFTTAFDMAYHYMKFFHQAKMSTQEIKDEHKDIEGNVDVKRKIRSKQLSMLKQRLMQTVPKADVIITNPTHYAVALRYQSTKDKAPKVIAKGKDLQAHQIRQIAIANAVSIYQAPELARAIYFTTKVGHEIHPLLYKAVAVVLSYVYQLKRYQMGSGEMPHRSDELHIPKEFVYRE